MAGAREHRADHLAIRAHLLALAHADAYMPVLEPADPHTGIGAGGGHQVRRSRLNRIDRRAVARDDVDAGVQVGRSPLVEARVKEVRLVERPHGPPGERRLRVAAGGA